MGLVTVAALRHLTEAGSTKNAAASSPDRAALLQSFLSKDCPYTTTDAQKNSV